MNPLLADALALAAPFVVALLTRARASNQLRAAISVGIVVALVAATYWGDANPDALEAIVAQFAKLVAIVVATYKMVDTLIGSKELNKLILPEVGVG